MAPAKPKYVVYFRVSTQKQGRSGFGLEAQKAAVQAYLSTHGGAELASFTEVESGKVNARPMLTAALLRCSQARATLLVAKLDRLSRNAAFLLNLKDSGVKFQALDLPEVNTLTLGVLAVIAQHERETISARTKAALAARKARGLPLGNPRDLAEYAKAGSILGQATNKAKALARAKEIKPLIEAAHRAGCGSLRDIADYLNEAEIPTPRGKRWTAMAVANAKALIEQRATQA